MPLAIIYNSELKCHQIQNIFHVLYFRKFINAIMNHAVRFFCFQDKRIYNNKI